MASESKRTVLVALAANLAIAIAKGAVGLITASSSMLAEAAHSLADSLNQVFLLTSLKTSSRPADGRHPFGYGKAQYFWSLLAAVGIFVAGALFSIYEGVHTLLHGGEATGGLGLPLAVLGIAFLAEGTSWLRAVHQMRGTARRGGQSFFDHLRGSKDPTVKTVIAEDSAALIGIVLAALGVTLRHVTGSAVWDGLAAIAIGLLLAWVAVGLGRQNATMLIGETADPKLVVSVYDRLSSYDEVAGVVELLTMHLGPESVLVAARVDLADGIRGEHIEEFAERADTDLREHDSAITELFLDPTRPDPELAQRTAAYVQSLRGPAGDVPSAPAPVGS